MGLRTDSFDLGRLGLRPGEGRRIDLEVEVDALTFGGQRYAVVPPRIAATLDVAKMTGGGHSLRLRFTASVAGPCMRCLEEADRGVSVDAREVDQRSRGDELASPYVADDELDVHAWTRDAFALALPQQVVCRDDCAGLCPECGADLNRTGADHGHERAPDPRWAKLGELRFE
jgi:uncharacterized protein